MPASWTGAHILPKTYHFRIHQKNNCYGLLSRRTLPAPQFETLNLDPRIYLATYFGCCFAAGCLGRSRGSGSGRGLYNKDTPVRVRIRYPIDRRELEKGPLKQAPYFLSILGESRNPIKIRIPQREERVLERQGIFYFAYRRISKGTQIQPRRG